MPLAVILPPQRPVLILDRLYIDRNWLVARTTQSIDKEYNGRHANKNHPVYYHHLRQPGCSRVDV
jgi:hypothetical protein